MITQQQAEQILNMLAEFILEHFPITEQVLKDYCRHKGIPADITHQIRFDVCRFTDIPVTSVRVSLREYSNRIEMTNAYLEDRWYRLQHISMRPEWWGLDYTQHPETNKPAKAHPDHPLIGIEWEPQLTLLNYPVKAIHIHLSDNSMTDIVNHDEKCEKYVIIYLSNKYSVYIDKAVENIELRTDPVKLDDLNTEIQKCQKVMEDIVKDIAKVAGPTGIFLPAFPCTKHVNVSFKEVNDRYASTYSIKGGDYGLRHHIKVPYNFTDYKSISQKPYDDYTAMKEPILLGYSYTGEVYTSRRELF